MIHSFKTILIIIILISPFVSFASENKGDSYFPTQECKKQTMNIKELIGMVISQPITSCDVATLSLPDLRIIRNAIFAKHGRLFKSKDLNKYFSSFTWYKINMDFKDEFLSSADKQNIDLIVKVEELKKITNKDIERSEYERLKITDDNDPLFAYRTELFHPLFPRYSEFLIPFSEMAISISEAKKLYGKEVDFLDLDIVPKKGKPMSTMEVETVDGPMTVSTKTLEDEALIKLPDNNGFLYAYEYHPLAAPDSWFSSLLFSSQGKYIKEFNYVPRNVLIDNTNLLVTEQDIGCCGTWGVRFDIYNLSNDSSISYECDDQSCDDALLSWLKDGKKLLIIYTHAPWNQESKKYVLEMKVHLIDTNGDVVVQGIFEKEVLLNNSIMNIHNLVGIRETLPEKEWLFKFEKDKEVYVVLSK